MACISSHLNPHSPMLAHRSPIFSTRSLDGLMQPPAPRRTSLTSSALASASATLLFQAQFASRSKGIKTALVRPHPLGGVVTMSSPVLGKRELSSAAFTTSPASMGKRARLAPVTADKVAHSLSTSSPQSTTAPAAGTTAPTASAATTARRTTEVAPSSISPSDVTTAAAAAAAPSAPPTAASATKQQQERLAQKRRADAIIDHALFDWLTPKHITGLTYSSPPHGSFKAGERQTSCTTAVPAAAAEVLASLTSLSDFLREEDSASVARYTAPAPARTRGAASHRAGARRPSAPASISWGVIEEMESEKDAALTAQDECACCTTR